MFLVVKGHSASDSDKPPNYWTVEDPEVIFKDRTTRSDRPDEYYHLSPTINTNPQDQTSLQHNETEYAHARSPRLRDSSSDIEGDFLTNLNAEWSARDDLVFGAPTTSTVVFDVGRSITTTASQTTVIYTDVLPTTVPVTLTVTPTVTTPVLLDLQASDTNDVGQVQTDNESDSEMTEINPPRFRGTTSENAEIWLRQFNNYCLYKTYDEDKARALFRVLLTDSAAVWYDSLEADIQTNWDNLKAAFLARYTTAEFLKYQHATELFNSKQGDKSVDDFCAHMQQLARQVGADEQMLRFAVLNGLRTDIKDHVTRSQPSTWKELVEAAKVGELCSPSSSSTDDKITVQLALVQDQLKELATQISKPQPVQSLTDTRPRSPSPRRVHFADDRTYRDGRLSRFDDYRNDSYNVRRRYDEQSVSPTAFGRCGNSGFRRSYGRLWRNTNSGTPRGQSNFRGRGRPIRGNNFRGRSPNFTGPCGRCGLRAHAHQNDCPAVNQACRGCGKTGHFLRVCRSANRTQTM